MKLLRHLVPKTVSLTRAFLPAVLVAIAPACGGSVGSDGNKGTGGSAGTSSGGTGGAGQTGGSGGTVQVGGSGGMGGSGGTGEECPNGPVCSAHFPCGLGGGIVRACIWGVPDQMYDNRAVPCAEVCGTSCCSGGSCEERISSCPDGTLCAYPEQGWTPYDSPQAACIDAAQACGPSVQKPCPDGQYCEIAGILCPVAASHTSDCVGDASACDYATAGGIGVCRPLPSTDECTVMPGPVCGCDGITYDNPCDRMRANVAWASSGPCP